LSSGGLGLTGGLVDVGNLYDCLVGIHLGLADDAILDRYSEVRRDKYLNFVDPVSTANLRRLAQSPEEAVAKDEFFQICAQIQNEPEKVKELVMVRLLDLPVFVAFFFSFFLFSFKLSLTQITIAFQQ
jgi:2-polyprenyl-6-methoxyphenol hydroxylase-like FAD-dependent oxidoreductase